MNEETEQILPEKLEKGDQFRLTGVAEDPEEAADSNVYEVVDTDKKWLEMNGRKILIGCNLLVKVDGKLATMTIGPWVPVLRMVKNEPT